MAGGGSAVSLAALIFFGLDAGVANGSNRIAILLQNAVGTYSFHRAGAIEYRSALHYCLWIVPGALLGVYFAVRITDSLFEQILSAVLICVAASLLFPTIASSTEGKARRGVLFYPVLFLTGVYGGFIQAGVGFLVMFCMRHFQGLDLVRTNALKVLLIFVYTVPVLAVFGLNQKIDWLFAVALACGNGLGAWCAVRAAIEKGEGIVKLFVVVAIILMALKLLW